MYFVYVVVLIRKTEMWMVDVGALCRFSFKFFAVDALLFLSSSSFNWLVKWSFSISLNSHWNALSYFHEFLLKWNCGKELD